MQLLTSYDIDDADARACDDTCYDEGYSNGNRIMWNLIKVSKYLGAAKNLHLLLFYFAILQVSE